MGSIKHRGATKRWGTPLTSWDETRHGILNWGGRRRHVFLPHGGADKPLPGGPPGLTARELAHQGRVECIFPGCGAYATVNKGPSKNDGTRGIPSFVHPNGRTTTQHVEENAETVDHQRAKADLLTWIRESYPEQIDDFDADEKNLRLQTAEGTTVVRRPDAWVRFTGSGTGNGAQIAIEYQHSAGDPDYVVDKTRLYERNGITVWWIFSARSKRTWVNPRPARKVNEFGDTIADLTPTQQRLARERIPFFWYDVDQRLLATPMICAKVKFDSRPGELWLSTPYTSRQYWRQPVPEFHEYGRAFVHSLDECDIALGSGRLITPGTGQTERAETFAAREIDRLRAEAREKYAEEQRRQRDDAERARTASEEAEREAEALAAKVAEAERNAELEAAESRRTKTDLAAEAAVPPAELNPYVIAGRQIPEAEATSASPWPIVHGPDQTQDLPPAVQGQVGTSEETPWLSGTPDSPRAPEQAVQESAASPRATKRQEPGNDATPPSSTVGEPTRTVQSPGPAPIAEGPAANEGRWQRVGRKIRALLGVRK